MATAVISHKVCTDGISRKGEGKTQTDTNVSMVKILNTPTGKASQTLHAHIREEERLSTK